MGSVEDCLPNPTGGVGGDRCWRMQAGRKLGEGRDRERQRQMMGVDDCRIPTSTVTVKLDREAMECDAPLRYQRLVKVVGEEVPDTGHVSCLCPPSRPGTSVAPPADWLRRRTPSIVVCGGSRRQHSRVGQCACFIRISPCLCPSLDVLWEPGHGPYQADSADRDGFHAVPGQGAHHAHVPYIGPGMLIPLYAPVLAWPPFLTVDTSRTSRGPCKRDRKPCLEVLTCESSLDHVDIYEDREQQTLGIT